ncbi:MAG: sugar phosphate isomerase/epimerase [Sphingomonadales bacterium]|jgi:sugar phosphate isomerase/epimerase
MTDVNRRNFFAAGAVAGLAAGSAVGLGGAAPAAAGPRPGPGGGGPGLADVWGADFLYQWSPPENYKRDLSVGPRTIRLSSQSTPRVTGAEGVDYGALFKAMRDGGWTACEAPSNAWLERKKPDSEIREIKAQLQANDVKFYGLHCAGNIIAPDPDAERWQRHIIDTIHAAEEVGCELILTHAGSMHTNRNWAHPLNWSKEAWLRSVGALKRICRDTAGSKIKIAIEAVNTESINNPWAHKRLREDVGDDRICVGLDITNMVFPNVAYRMSEMLDLTFDMLGDQIAYVHAKDFVWNDMLPGMNWTMNGTGGMDYELFLARLSRLPLNPCMLVEFLTNNDEYSQAQRNIRAIAAKLGVKIHGTQA